MSETGPELIRCCAICGAVITEDTTATHSQWHDRLNEQVKAAQSGIGFMGIFAGGQERV